MELYRTRPQNVCQLFKGRSGTGVLPVKLTAIQHVQVPANRVYTNLEGHAGSVDENDDQQARSDTNHS